MSYPNNGGYPNNDGYGNNGGFRQPFNPSPPYASTPLNVRTQRPRFAYSGPPNYPRPGSSASKPNPRSSFSEIMRSRYTPLDSMNDSMMNNCGDSLQSMDGSFPSNDNSFTSEYSSGSFQAQDSTMFYSCNESFGSSPRKQFPPTRAPYDPSPPPEQEPPQHPYKIPFKQTSPILNQPNRFKAVSSMVDSNKRKPFYGKKKEWRCTVCDIEFTSRIPYNMHYRGAKHAKKLKAKEALQSIQSQVVSKDIAKVGTTFRCDLCGIIANSTFQLQTHLEGVKHKNKLLQLEEVEAQAKLDKQEAQAKKGAIKEEGKITKVNGTKTKETPKKAVVSVVPSNPAEHSTVKPAITLEVKKTVFSCDLCSLTLNSDGQLQQHLTGKYHQARLEGKTNLKKKHFMRKGDKAKNEETTGQTKTTPAVESLETAMETEPSMTQTILGVKTLAASFIPGETLN